MKFVILVVLLAGANCAFPPSGPASTEQLPSLGNAANVFQKITGVLNTLSAQLSETNDASIFKMNVVEVTSTVEALAANVTSVADAISSGESLSGINKSLQAFVDATTDEYNALIGASDESGSSGSYEDVEAHAFSLQYLAGENYELAGAINGLSGDTAVAFGEAAKSYNLPDSFNALADARSNLASIAKAIAAYSADASVILDLANSEFSLAASEYDLADAFENAANK